MNHNFLFLLIARGLSWVLDIMNDMLESLWILLCSPRWHLTWLDSNSAPPAVSSSWNLHIVFSSLNCQFFSKTPMTPPHVWLLASWLKIWVDPIVGFGGSPPVWLYFFPPPHNIVNSLLWHFKMTRLMLSATQAFVDWGVPPSKSQSHQPVWQWSFKGGLPGSVCLLWSPSGVFK